MSSSAAYYVSPIDVAARRRRELRTEIAGLRTRLRRLQRRATALGASVDRTAGVAGDTDDVAALEAAADRLRAAIGDTEQQISDGWNTRWQHEISATATINRSATPSASAELATGRERVRARQDERRAQVLSDIGRLLAASGPRCDPADADALAGRYQQMSTIDKLDDLREAALDLSIAMREAVERQKAAGAGEELRARLLNLLDEALPEDRDRLRENVRAAADVRPWAGEVHQAVRRADLARHRDLVARAVRQALADAGCEPAEDFTDLLLSERETVVRLDPGGDYGLLVRLPDAGGQLLTAVVRGDDTPRDADRDVRTQREFCEHALPTITSSLGRNGITVDPVPFLLLEPGRMPVPEIPSTRLSRRRPAKRRPAAQAAPRERSR